MDDVRRDSARKIGFEGESIAAKWLAMQGFDILERNFYVRGGEIDIIAMDGKTLVFVEVKFRATSLFGTAQDSFGKRKRMHLKSSAMRFLEEHGENYAFTGIRFDLVTVTRKKSGKLYLKYFENVDTHGA